MTGKGKILEELQPLIQASESSPFQKSVLISEFSDKLGLDPEQVMQGFRSASRKKPARRPVVGTEKETKTKVSGPLPRKQAQLLEFLIFCPQYMKRFIEAGIEDILVQNPASDILQAMQKLSDERELTGPEQIMEALPEGPERSYVSRLLISSSLLEQDDPEVIEEMADEMLVWLVRYRFKKEIQQLSDEIRTAQENQDSKLLDELLLRKAELNKHMADMNIGDT